jgi:outer membrane protein assembly factor BamA
MLRIRLFLFFLAIAPMGLKAQSYQVRLHGVDMPDEKLSGLLKPFPAFEDGKAAYNAIRKLVPQLQEQGYLAASVDSISVGGTGYDAFVYVGEQYRWAHVSLNEFPPALFTATAINTVSFSSRSITPGALSRISERVLSWYENNGFPFARIWLDSIVLQEGGGISGKMMVDKGALRVLDSVVIYGEVRISKNYLLRYLDMAEGMPYNEAKLRTISTRLRELPFLQEEKPWSVQFRTSETKLYLDLKERPANTANAIIGLLPNSQQTGKFLLTIDAQLSLHNILGFGETLSATFQKLQYRSQTIQADAAWPYLFNTLLGVDGHFDLYSKDSSFTRTNFQLGARYLFGANDYLRVFYENKGNRLGDIDTGFVIANKRLPDNADITANGGGAELVLNRTDFRLNPRKGWQVKISGNALLRKVRRSDKVTGLRDGLGYDYTTLYDSLENNAYQYHLTADAAYYVPVGKRATLKTGYNGGWVGGGELFQNELYQVGGFRLLRGFDEQSLFVNQYHVLTLELRLLLSRTSNVYLFSDNAWLQSQFNENNTEGIYNGFGVGTSLDTKTGIFTISYALGRSDFNPLQLRQSKIHFGYVAYF